jgi:predicted neutral ceramidase superfamily lipid hydrolase
MSIVLTLIIVIIIISIVMAMYLNSEIDNKENGEGDKINVNNKSDDKTDEIYSLLKKADNEVAKNEVNIIDKEIDVQIEILNTLNKIQHNTNSVKWGIIILLFLSFALPLILSAFFYNYR